MRESALSFLRELPSVFRLADAVDIVLIALILYAVIVWFRETTSRRVLVGVVLLAGTYFAARHFDLYLTSQLLHAGFTVLLIVLVVVFQEDLRRAFERIATFGSLEIFQRSPLATFDSDVLVEVAFDLAAKRHGALLVLPGNDPLARHVHGGVELSGVLSRPLLDSLFDPGSVGHDGAVLVEGGKVSKFSVHLPISKNRRSVGALGTRHAAALGLSERTDALTIVVSEERGVVSLTERGKLRDVHSAMDLKRRLDSFAAEKFPAMRDGFWTTFIVRNRRAKVLSLAIAAVAWLVLAYNPSTIQRTFVVPIEYRNVPEELAINAFAPTETRVTLSGTEPAFRLLEPATMKIALDLSDAGPGKRRVQVGQRKNLTVPANLSVYRIEHSTISLYLSHRSESKDGASPDPNTGTGQQARDS